MGISRMAPGERYMTAREVADRVGLSTDTILRYYRDGRIPGRRMPGQIRPVRFLWSEVEAAFNGIADQAADEARRGVDRPARRACGVSAQRGQIFRPPSGLWAIRYRDAQGRRPQRTGFRTTR